MRSGASLVRRATAIEHRRRVGLIAVFVAPFAGLTTLLVLLLVLLLQVMILDAYVAGWIALSVAVVIYVTGRIWLGLANVARQRLLRSSENRDAVIREPLKPLDRFGRYRIVECSGQCLAGEHVLPLWALSITRLSVQVAVVLLIAGLIYIARDAPLRVLGLALGVSILSLQIAARYMCGEQPARFSIQRARGRATIRIESVGPVGTRSVREIHAGDLTDVTQMRDAIVLLQVGEFRGTELVRIREPVPRWQLDRLEYAIRQQLGRA